MDLIAKKPEAAFVTMTREIVDALLAIKTGRLQRSARGFRFRRALRLAWLIGGCDEVLAGPNVEVI